MDSVCFRKPLGLLVELASYKLNPLRGCGHADVMMLAHRARIAYGDANITEVHAADAIEQLVQRTQESLSGGRGAKNPYWLRLLPERSF